MKKEFIAIIPARGGSKGVPRKNIKDLAGKPLIYYTINAAKKSKYIKKIFVSTEDPEIKKIVGKYDVDVIDRPKKLSGDKTPGVEVIKHAIIFLKNLYHIENTFLVILSATTPFKTSTDIDNAIKKFLNSNSDYLVSVSEVHPPPEWMYKIKQGKLVPIIKEGKLTRRQDAIPTYQLNGAIYIAKIPAVLKNNSLLGRNKTAYIMPDKRSIDIDSKFDFTMSSLLMKYLKKSRK